MRGSFAFGVGVTPAEGSATTSQTAPRIGELTIAVLRWVEYLSLLQAIGTLLLRRLARSSAELGWVRSRPVLPLAVAFGSGLAVVSSEAFSAAGSVSLSPVWSYLTIGLPGLARLSRLGLEALALLTTVVNGPMLWILVTAVVGALAASGHGAAIHPVWWGIGVDAAHLLAAGIWGGGILALATVRPPAGGAHLRLASCSSASRLPRWPPSPPP